MKNINLLKQLLSKGVQLNTTDHDGNHALLLAQLSSDNDACVSTLIKAGSSINVMNKYRQTPLAISMDQNNRDIFNELLNFGADVNYVFVGIYTYLVSEHLYWPGLDADIADYTRRCQECIRRSQPPKEPLQAHEVPQEPWERIAMDYFYMNGSLYILICDYFSKFPFMFQVKTTSFTNLKDHLEELFSVEGIPDEIMSDNGTPL